MLMLIAILIASCNHENKSGAKTSPVVDTKIDKTQEEDKQVPKNTSTPIAKEPISNINTEDKARKLYGIKCVIPKAYKPTQKDFKVKNLKGEVVSVSSKFVAEPNSKEITIKSYPSHKKPEKILTKSGESLLNLDGNPGLLKTEILSKDGKGHPLKNKHKRFILRIYPDNNGEIKIIYTAPIASADKDFDTFVQGLSFQ